MTEREILVVGAGPIGAATARWLAEDGHRVTVVGPSEPESHARAKTPWSGHYDQGRIAAIDAMYVPTVLGSRSMRRFTEIERASDITFTSAMPLLTTFPADWTPAADNSTASWRNLDALLANVAELGGQVEVLTAEDIGARFPQLRIPTTDVGVLQADALLVNPRLLTEAELLLAENAGASRLEDEVTVLERSRSGWGARLRSGKQFVADRVVVAIGAYTNASGLLAPFLPAPLGTSVFGATIVLLEVEGPEAADFPGYMFSSDHYGGGLITPPRRYPDGRWYLKCAGGELVDHPLGTADEIDAWVRSGGSASEIDFFRDLVAQVLPGARVTSALTKPCLPTFNASGLPYVDRVAEGLVVATEGERGVMMADEIGRLAAGLAGQNRWIDPIPSDLFSLRQAS